MGIFTTACAHPFAGHPNVGTAFVLAATGELGETRSSLTVTFEEEAGLVSVAIHEAQGRVAWCELAAPQPVSLGATLPPQLVASAVSLAAEDVVTETHQPQLGSVGLPFLITELRNRSALERARVNPGGFEALRAEGIWPAVYLYVRATDGFDLRARMFSRWAASPRIPRPEARAVLSPDCSRTTAGSLAGASAGASRKASRWGRPSTLLARAEKADGVVRADLGWRRRGARQRRDPAP